MQYIRGKMNRYEGGEIFSLICNQNVRSYKVTMFVQYTLLHRFTVSLRIQNDGQDVTSRRHNLNLSLPSVRKFQAFIDRFDA